MKSRFWGSCRNQILREILQLVGSLLSLPVVSKGETSIPRRGSNICTVPEALYAPHARLRHGQHGISQESMYVKTGVEVDKNMSELTSVPVFKIADVPHDCMVAGVYSRSFYDLAELLTHREKYHNE